MWQPPSAPEALKKRMLRTVLHAIILDTTQEPPEHVVPRHWHGGGHTEWHVARQTAGTHGRTTDRDALEVIRALSTGGFSSTSTWTWPPSKPKGRRCGRAIAVHAASLASRCCLCRHPRSAVMILSRHRLRRRFSLI